LVFLLAVGVQVAHKPPCGGGACLPRPSPYGRVRLGGLNIWRIQLSLSRLSCTCIQGLANRALWHKRWRPRCLLASEAREASIGLTIDDAGFVVSSGWPSALTLLSCYIATGNLASRPVLSPSTCWLPQSVQRLCVHVLLTP